MSNLKNKKVNWVLSGHVHSGDHEVTNYYCEPNGTPHEINIVNVSIKDEDYKVTYKPFEFEL